MDSVHSDIVLREISKSFGDRQVLRHLDYTFPADRITCVQGPSGQGKTTLLKIVAGLEKPDAGSISGVPEKVAFVFQEDRLCEDFSAVANIRLVCGKRLTRDQIEDHLRQVGLSAQMYQPVREFSGGMKRRVAVARAVCFGADLLLMDEPFKGLDGPLRRQVMDYVTRNTSGKTVICVTHEDAEAAYFASQVLNLSSVFG